MEIEGAYQGMECWADVAVSEFYADARENINELRIIDTELVLDHAQVFEAQEGKILLMHTAQPGHHPEKEKSR